MLLRTSYSPLWPYVERIVGIPSSVFFTVQRLCARRTVVGGKLISKSDIISNEQELRRNWKDWEAYIHTRVAAKKENCRECVWGARKE
jgi:hypothetical protein